jgi:hypothetical protein
MSTERVLKAALEHAKSHVEMYHTQILHLAENSVGEVVEEITAQAKLADEYQGVVDQIEKVMSKQVLKG